MSKSNDYLRLATKAVEFWKPVLRLDWHIQVKIGAKKDGFIDDPGTQTNARILALDEYQKAIILLNPSLGPDDLREPVSVVILHELCHTLFAGVQDAWKHGFSGGITQREYDLATIFHDKELERAVEHITRVLWALKGAEAEDYLAAD